MRRRIDIPNFTWLVVILGLGLAIGLTTTGCTKPAPDEQKPATVPGQVPDAEHKPHAATTEEAQPEADAPAVEGSAPATQPQETGQPGQPQAGGEQAKGEQAKGEQEGDDPEKYKYCKDPELSKKDRSINLVQRFLDEKVFETVSGDRLQMDIVEKSFEEDASLRVVLKKINSEDPAKRVGFLSVAIDNILIGSQDYLNILARCDGTSGSLRVGLLTPKGVRYELPTNVFLKDGWSLVRVPLSEFKRVKEGDDPESTEELSGVISSVDFTLDVYGTPSEVFTAFFDKIYLS